MPTSCRRKDSEKAVERRLVEGAAAMGGKAIKLLSDQYSGLPDRLVLMPGGSVVFVELKTTGEKPRKIQLKRHGELRALGFRVEVIDTISGVDKFLEEYEQR